MACPHLLVCATNNVQDWSLQCPSNAIWSLKIYLSQNNPSKRNSKLKMKTSLEILNILCPSSIVYMKIDQSLLTASLHGLPKWPKKVHDAIARDQTRVTRVTSGNTYHYTTTTHGKPQELVRPPLGTVLQIELFNALQFQNGAKLIRHIDRYIDFLSIDLVMFQ